MSDKLTELGILPSDITPSVSVAVNGLLEHIEHLNKNLIDVYSQLEKLQNLIDTDTNPALPNRKSFLKRLNWTIQMSRRLSEPSCVVTLRVRRFDQIESQYGFQAKNAAVNHLARTLSNSIRDTDFFARVGENEFAVIMFFANIENAKAKAGSLCFELGNKPLLWNSAPIHFEGEFGAHQISISDSPENALLAANNALFAARGTTTIESVDLNS